MTDCAKDFTANADTSGSLIPSSDEAEKKMGFAFKILFGAALAAIVLLVVVLCLYFWRFHEGFSSENADWGTFGDFVGGTLNPIFSLLAFFALLYTIKLQSRELRNSSEQLKKSAGSLETQNKHWEYQNFQSSFFTVFTIYNNSISDLFFSTRNGDYKGIQAFDRVVRVLLSDLESSQKHNPNVSFQDHLKNVFEDEEIESFCRNYVRVLIRALAFFDAYEIVQKEKKKLVNYFVKGIGSDESAISFYYSIYYYKTISALENIDFLPKKFNIYRGFFMDNKVGDEKQWLDYFKKR